MVRVWNKRRGTMNGGSQDGSNWLRDGTSNEAKQTLPTEKRLKLTFPKENVLLIELYGNTVNDI